jgi:disulfide bond formation protein DsbB
MTLSSPLPSPRIINGLGLFGCVFANLFAIFYLQGHLGLEPCPLCIIDRVIVGMIGILFLLALIHNPHGWGQRIYGGLGALVSGLGVAVCIRHIWLQGLPPDQVPACAPGLDYMLDTLPMMETLKIVFTTAGECAEVQWTFLGLSIPEQTLLVFLGFLVLNLIQLGRKTAAN